MSRGMAKMLKKATMGTRMVRTVMAGSSGRDSDLDETWTKL
jgi:hypothetical protein